VAVASIAAAVVASMAAEVTAEVEVMASMALPSWWVPAAGGMPMANAYAGGDIDLIAVA
jgi:hypothetical protein